MSRASRKASRPVSDSPITTGRIFAAPNMVFARSFATTPGPPRISSIWNRAQTAVERKRGPRTDTENYAKVSRIIGSYGPKWTCDDNLLEICDEFDTQKIPPPITWAGSAEGPARSWSRGRQLYPQLVIRAIKDRLEALEEAGSAES